MTNCIFCYKRESSLEDPLGFTSPTSRNSVSYRRRRRAVISRRFFTLCSCYLQVDFEHVKYPQKILKDDDEEGPPDVDNPLGICEECVSPLQSFCDAYRRWQQMELELNLNLENIEEIMLKSDKGDVVKLGRQVSVIQRETRKKLLDRIIWKRNRDLPFSTMRRQVRSDKENITGPFDLSEDDVIKVETEESGDNDQSDQCPSPADIPSPEEDTKIEETEETDDKYPTSPAYIPETEENDSFSESDVGSDYVPSQGSESESEDDAMTRETGKTQLTIVDDNLSSEEGESADEVVPRKKGDTKVKKMTKASCKSSTTTSTSSSSESEQPEGRNRENGTYPETNPATDGSLRDDGVEFGGPFKCPFCPEEFDHFSDYKKHEGAIHEAENPLQCRLCEQQFVTIGERNRHERTHTKPFKCSTCGGGFTVPCYLKVHMRTHTGDKPYQCPLCPQRFVSKEKCRRHELKFHNKHAKKPFKCPICPMDFWWRHELSAHLRTVKHTRGRGTPESFVCSICGQVLKNGSSLNKHELIHTSTAVKQKHQCRFCGSSFANPNTLRTHENQHVGRTPFKCRVCDIKFHCASKRRRHELTAHATEDLVQGKAAAKEAAQKEMEERRTAKKLSKKPRKDPPKIPFNQPEEVLQMMLDVALAVPPESLVLPGAPVNRPGRQKIKGELKCLTCGKVFEKRDQLRSHKKMHARQFKCSVCDRRFATAEGLERHGKLHSKERQFKCKTCKKRFVTKNARDRHLKIHEGGEKRFKCAFCDKAFTVKVNLQDHELKHTGRKGKFKCRYCEYACDIKGSINRHEKTHEKDLGKILRCPLCEITFTRKFDLHRHLTKCKNSRQQSETVAPQTEVKEKLGTQNIGNDEPADNPHASSSV